MFRHAEIRSDVYYAIKENIDIDLILLTPLKNGNPDSINRLKSHFDELLEDCDKMFESLENGSVVM